MIFSTKDSKENFKHEIGQAMFNASGLIAFVGRQETNIKTHYEFKQLNEFYDTLVYLWDYVDMCDDEDVTAVVSDYSCNLVRLLSDVDVKAYKSYYRDYGEYSILASI